MEPMDLPRELIETILADYALPRLGVHGLAHWARVYENGRRLAALTGADLQVVTLFAVLHDCRRRNEARDPGHGARAAQALRGFPLDLDPRRLDLLSEACAHHTDGLIEADVTIQTCWDADRLDLGRVGITPDPRRLCTDAARDPAVIAWATQRARDGFRPPVMEKWV